MIIRYIFAVLIFLILMFYLSYLNPDNLQFHLTPGTVIPISTSLLILSSMGIGAFLVMIAVIFRDTRKGLADWREKGRLKKKEKIMELYQQGVNDLLSRKKVEALKSFEKILEWDPKHLDALRRAGEVYRYNGDINKSIQHHARARSLAPDNLSVLFSLSKAYRHSGQDDEAAEIYRTALKIDKRNIEAFFKLRDLYERKEEWEKAYNLQKGYWGLKKDLREKKRLLYYQFMKASLLDQGKEREKIIKIYSELIKADKAFAAPYLELGRMYETGNSGDQAVKTWKKGFKETREVVFLEALDGYYRKLEDPEGSIRVYKEAIRRSPENPTFKFLLGKLYYRLEVIDEALEIFEKLIIQGIRIPILRQILGDIYYKRGRVEEAFLEYKKSVDFVRPIMVPYSCRTCGHEQEEWRPDCPVCGKLEPLTILLPQPEKSVIPKRISAAAVN
jgi:lipopolysaccharide biosynthesis regulator YciM